MKILITTDWYRPTINGVVASVCNLSRELLAQGHDVKILTLSPDLHSRQEERVIYLGSLAAGAVYPQARIKISPGSQYLQALIHWRPDVIHSQCEFSTFGPAQTIAKACGSPLVHTYHTDYETLTHYFCPSQSIGQHMAAAFAKHILNQTQLVIAPTAKIQQKLAAYHIQPPVAVIPSGLNLSPFAQKLSAAKRQQMRQSWGIQKEEVVLLYLGRLAQEKNIQALLVLLQQLQPTKIKLLLVGDGPYRQQLQKLTQTLGIARNVIFAGMVPPAEVAAYYQTGDIFVNASQNETQGLTYLEAMASGLPLLCLADPCLDGVIQQGKNGFLYQNAGEFQQYLNRLVASAHLRQQIGQAAAKTVWQQYSAKTFAERVLAAYRQVLAEKAANDPDHFSSYFKHAMLKSS